ncbi:class I SAM-dependent methyltransferase, partial [Patescibacteria group bacterium]|nr:class I SAM-dependent methyltransferase [Patescibacteria group bacterium]
MDNEETPETQETVRRYNVIAEEYSRDWRGQHDPQQIQALNEFIVLVGEPNEKKILEVGCGSGKDCIYFAEKGLNIIGLDLSSGMLEQARKNAKKKNLKIQFVQSSMSQLDFPDAYFDGIWTKAALVHIAPNDYNKVLSEFNRVLKRDGFIHIWIQNFLWPKHILRFCQSFLSYLKNSQKPLLEKIHEFVRRLKIGYAYIDERHWFYAFVQTLLRNL